MKYPITLTPDDNDTFLVTCPLVREVATVGSEEAEVRVMALDALLTAFGGRVSDREPIPVPGPFSGPFVNLGLNVALKIELHNAMVEAALRKADLIRRLSVHAPQVDRLLDFHHISKIDHMEHALRAVGRRVVVTTEPA